MITYFGWEDGISQPALFAYRDRVAGRLGAAKADRTWRIFMVPGMGHCSGGRGADYFDLMTPLVDWVEAGIAPEEATAVKRDAAGAPTFQRRLCPYPKVAVLKDTDPNLAASYRCEATRK
jgi:hypothetical protein